MAYKKQKNTLGLFRFLQKLPKTPIIIIAALSASLLLVVFLLWPRQIDFSYHRQACIAHPVIAPGLMPRNEKFHLIPDRVVKIAGISLVAGGICVQPVEAPLPGDYQMAVLGKQITIKVGEAPELTADLLDSPVATARILRFPTNTSDAVFDYRAIFNERAIKCQNVMSAVNCDVSSLGLRQGTQYNFRLERYFRGARIATIIERQVATLSAVTIQATSILRDEMVFTRPKTAEIALDKSIESAEMALVRVDGNKEVIPLKTRISGKSVIINWDNDLVRQAVYQLTISKIKATDGSGLTEPFMLPFKTSGGPRVKNVSVGTAKVPIGATATITFDQPLSAAQDVSKVITMSGGASIVGRIGSQVTVSFAGVPRCSDVTIRVSDQLQSNYGVSGGNAWQYGTRTICHTIGSIGTSVQGRAINAYYFGSGPSVILFTGAIHGNETSTRALMLRWIDDLESNARAIPADKTVIVIPSLNPDGVAAGTRTNAHNVDLNRNFDTSDWKTNITTVANAPFPGGGGPTPLSEPETRAIAGFVSRVRPLMVLSYHSVGGVVAANGIGVSSGRAGLYASVSGYGNASGSTGSVFEYSVSGTAEDYYAQRLGVASILVELGSHTYHQFERNQKAMWAMLK